MKHLGGMRGRECLVGIILTPCFIPIWILMGISHLLDRLEERWWNS